MEKVYLTKLAPIVDVQRKVGPGTLAGVLCGLPKFQDPNLLVGTETSDDAAVLQNFGRTGNDSDPFDFLRRLQTIHMILGR